MIVFVPVILYFGNTLRKVIMRLFSAYFKSVSFSNDGNKSDDEESIDTPFAEYHDEKGVVFFPPVYTQRYAAVIDSLMDDRWSGKLTKVIDFGYHDTSFIKHLINVPGVNNILGVDIDSIPLQCSIDVINFEKCVNNKDLIIQLYQGNAADPDYRLIGCDGVVAIEMIEHMLPYDLERFVHTIFGFIKPKVAIITTPNGDFNVLFKALESNGLRRMDHFFEWSQDQFHEWCSNIVKRYPQYTVSCKGIGPGPPGTEHLGCCSQLAMFVNEDYHKQPDLNINSLALVSDRVKSQSDTSDWCDITTENNSDTNYSSTLTLTTSKTSQISCSTYDFFKTLETRRSDKVIQCDLDLENCKCFLMFNQDLGLNVLMPRPKNRQNNYVIEDITRRLNCSISHIKKFSRESLNMVNTVKNKPLEHIKDISNNIYALIEMLQLKECYPIKKEGIWYNINWGEDAPYWNQYYKLVNEFKYPFKPKSEEELILDIVSDELHKTLDKLSESQDSLDVKISIPFAHIMATVQHITSDEAKVREVLEWNGYELTENALFHIRSLEPTDDDSDGCDYLNKKSLCFNQNQKFGNYNASLHKVLLKKISKLRYMISQEQFKSNMESMVLCRLASLSMVYAKSRKFTPNCLWLQCKLYDLCIIYERSEEFRRRLYIKTYRFTDKIKENENLNRYKNDTVPNEIFDKYNHLLNDSKDEKSTNHEQFHSDMNSEFVYLRASDSSFMSIELSVTKTCIDNVKNLDSETSSDETGNASNASSLLSCEVGPTANILKGAVLSEVFYLQNEVFTNAIIPETNFSLVSDSSNDKIQSNHDKIFEMDDAHLIIDVDLNIENDFEIDDPHLVNDYDDNIVSQISVNLEEKEGDKNFNAIKAYDYALLDETQRFDKLYQKTIAKPIPNDLLEFCKLKEEIANFNVNENCFCDYAFLTSTEHSQLISIINEDVEETIALRRTIATDIDELFFSYENSNQENDMDTNINMFESMLIENLNEPTTSKGFRHTNIDVQCGSDTAMSVSLCNLLPEQGLEFKSNAKSITPVCSNVNFKANPSDSVSIKNYTGVVIKNVTNNLFFENEELPSTSFEDCKDRIEIEQENSVPQKSNSSIVLLPLKSIENIKVTSIHNSDDSSTLNLLKNSFSFQQQSEIKIINENLYQSKDMGAETITAFLNKLVLDTVFKSNTSLGCTHEIIKNISNCSLNKFNCSRGSIQMHSYQQKKISEDVMYQGNWHPKSYKKCHNEPTVTNNTVRQSISVIKKNQSKVTDVKNFNLKIAVEPTSKISCNKSDSCKKVKTLTPKSHPIKKQYNNSNGLEKNKIFNSTRCLKENAQNEVIITKHYHRTCKYPNFDKENRISGSTKNKSNKSKVLKIKSRPSFSNKYSCSGLVCIAPNKKVKASKPAPNSLEKTKINKKSAKYSKRLSNNNYENKENVLLDDKLFPAQDKKEMLPFSINNDKIYKFENVQVSTVSNIICNETDGKKLLQPNVIPDYVSDLPSFKNNGIENSERIIADENMRSPQSISLSHGLLNQIINNVMNEALDNSEISESNSVESNESIKTSIQILPLKDKQSNNESELKHSPNASTIGSEFLISDTNLDTCPYASDNSYIYESTSQQSENVSTRRSSVTSFQSCQTDELFSPQNLTNRAQDTDEDESLQLAHSAEASIALTADSGNPIDNINLPGAGAGDGRGIHSDYSHDSSDRGASDSTDITDVSSRAYSEMISLSSATDTFHESSASFASSLAQGTDNDDFDGTPLINYEFDTDVSSSET